MIELTIPVLGLPVTIETAESRLARCFAEQYGSWSDACLPRQPGARGVRLRCALLPQGRHGCEGVGAVSMGTPLRIRVWKDRLALRGNGARGAAWSRAAVARCELAEGWLDQPARTRSEVLDTLLLFVLTRQDRVPLHAAGLACGDVAAVLAGPAGSGKSTLALHGVRAGLQLLSEDTVYIQARPGRVWGWPGGIHVAPAQLALLGGIGASGERVRNGKRKAVIEPSHATRLDSRTTGAAPALYRHRSALFLLERGRGPASLTVVDRAEAMAALSASIEPGFASFRAQLPAAVRAVASEGCWRLSLSADSAAAVALVRHTIAAIG